MTPVDLEGPLYGMSGYAPGGGPLLEIARLPLASCQRSCRTSRFHCRRSARDSEDRDSEDRFTSSGMSLAALRCVIISAGAMPDKNAIQIQVSKIPRKTASRVTGNLLADERATCQALSSSHQLLRRPHSTVWRSPWRSGVEASNPSTARALLTSGTRRRMS
jgi:hypothetical protein